MAVEDGVCAESAFRGFRVIVVPEELSVDKWCPRCRQWLPATPEVFGTRSSRDSLRSYCKRCDSADRNGRKPHEDCT